jgi:uncharacterized repeat protein (TIGR01451 family)
MNIDMRLLASASALAVASLGASPALAAGTVAGSTITNSVTLNYQVGGVDQAAITATDTFTVDRKINVVVAEDGNATTSVAPGRTSAVTTFIVTNSSNAPLDFALAASQPTGGSAKHGGSDNFNVSNTRIYLDANDNSIFDGTDTLVTHLNELAADDSKRVFIVADVPLGRTTGDIAAVVLTATAREANGATTLGAAITQTTGANTSGVDTVFADLAGNGNTAGDGAGLAADDYTVSAASITATKTSRIVSDPVNGTANPKMIPGAVVEYCIAVANAAGGASATNVSISDTLPTQTSYLSAFGILVNGTVTGSTCNADGSAGGSQASGTITASLSDIAAGAARTVLFRVTVN